MVLAAGFYHDYRAHNAQEVSVVKYIVVYGQIKAADQKYCHNQKWPRNLKEISFRTRGFGDNLDDFWPRYCKEKVLDLSRVVEAYSYRINFKLFKRGKEVKEEYAFSVDKKTHERKIRLCT